MKANFKSIVIIALAAVIGAVGSYLVLRSGDAPDRKQPIVREMQVVKTKTVGSKKTVKKTTVATDKDGKQTVKIDTEIVNRPRVADDVEEENLTEVQKSVLRELQDALDDNDVRRVRKALSKFLTKAVTGGADQVPACMRSKAVEALGWFGKETAVDLIGFMADSNQDVSNDASMAFEQALSDCEMGDRERSQLVSSMMTALSDPDQIESLMNQLNDMRNSVKAQTAIEILSKGTDEAKARLLEDIEVYFDEDVKDVDSLEKWKAMNPDDADDDDLYGGH